MVNKKIVQWSTYPASLNTEIQWFSSNPPFFDIGQSPALVHSKMALRSFPWKAELSTHRRMTREFFSGMPTLGFSAPRHKNGTICMILKVSPLFWLHSHGATMSGQKYSRTRFPIFYNVFEVWWIKNSPVVDISCLLQLRNPTIFNNLSDFWTLTITSSISFQNGSPKFFLKSWAL